MTPLPADGILKIPLDLLDDAQPDGRSVPPTHEQDRAMAMSMDIDGQLQNVGAGLCRADGRYPMRFGFRRLRAARALGWATLDVKVQDWTDAEVASIRAAENMLRVPLHAVDQWTAVRDQVERGASIAAAAAHCGLTERETQRMLLLSKLHPDLIALMRVDMPTDRALRVIARATPAKQKTASVKNVVRDRDTHPQAVQWDNIAAACRVTEIPRRLAIFDTDQHGRMFDDDLFVQPDDPDRFATRQVDKFLELQHAALTDRVAADRAMGRRIELAEAGAGGLPVMDARMVLIQVAPPGDQIAKKPTRLERIFTCVTPNGAIVEVLAEDAVAKREAADRRAAARAMDAPDALEAPEPEDKLEPPARATGSIITRAGMDMIAAAKTRALHAAIDKIDSTQDMLRAMILATAADGVRFGGLARSAARQIAAALLLPGGQPAEIDRDALLALASQVLTDALAVGTSGDAAEWIGTLAGADGFLERFDNAAFLACVKGEALRAVADALVPSSSKRLSLDDIRGALAGKAAEWRPDGAAFGAACPAVEAWGDGI